MHGGKAPQVQRKARENLEATKERVLLELCRLAYVDIRQAFDARGKLKAIAKLDPDTARALKSIQFDEFGKIKSIRLMDKKGALDSIAKHLGMFKDQVELSGPGGAPIPHKLEIVFVPPQAAGPPRNDRDSDGADAAQPSASADPAE